MLHIFCLIRGFWWKYIRFVDLLARLIKMSNTCPCFLIYSFFLSFSYFILHRHKPLIICGTQKASMCSWLNLNKNLGSYLAKYCISQPIWHTVSEWFLSRIGGFLIHTYRNESSWITLILIGNDLFNHKSWFVAILQAELGRKCTF